MLGRLYPLICRISAPSFVNAPISTHSNRIPVICPSLSMTLEYAGMFASAKVLTLHDLGYPQPATIIHYDNEVAVVLVNKTVKPKISKAYGMRWHWLQDRVGQGQFRVRHIPGVINVSDCFTKSLPLCRHKLVSPCIAVDDVPTIFPALNVPSPESSTIYSIQ
jgi:hypothetical protein